MTIGYGSPNKADTAGVHGAALGAEEAELTHEAQWAKSLCQKWGWNHELITLTGRQLINPYLRVSERLDEPLGDLSLISIASERKCMDKLVETASANWSAETNVSKIC